MDSWDHPPVRVGLIGAGPWAQELHGPMLAAGPETTLTGVWARRPEAARATAAALGTVAAGSVEELLDGCEAVAFAVPPDVQAELALLAADAGKALLLEKPLALDRPGAQRLAERVHETGVVAELVLTKRFHPLTRQFLADCAELATGGPLWALEGRYWHGGFLGGPFAHGWRLAQGALPDLGPHLVDLAVEVLGPVASVRAAGDSLGYLGLTCRHESGAVSALSLSGAVPGPDAVTRLDVAGPGGALGFDVAGIDHDECPPLIRRDWATAVRTGSPVLCDVDRGLLLARVVDAAWRSLRDGGAEVGTGWDEAPAGTSG